MKYPSHLLKVIDILKRLPGVGKKSAERFAFQMLDWPAEYLKEMAEVIHAIPEELTQCDECGCLSSPGECHFCQDNRLVSEMVCVIASPRDAFSLEATGDFKGLYHVLGGVLSPMEGFGPDKLTISKLKERIISQQIKEVVIALDSTLEGDTTSLYIKQELAALPVKISRLAFGLPMGSSLDYVDGGTLAKALSGRGSF